MIIFLGKNREIVEGNQIKKFSIKKGFAQFWDTFCSDMNKNEFSAKFRLYQFMEKIRKNDSTAPDRNVDLTNRKRDRQVIPYYPPSCFLNILLINNFEVIWECPSMPKKG